MKKRYLAMLMACLMLSASLLGCGAQQAQTGESTSTQSAETAAGETGGGETAGETTGSTDREIVNYWHIHTGQEAEVEEELIAAYNASQDQYEVVGLSMTDQQKLIVGMSSEGGPDVIFSSNSNLTTYYFNGLLQSLQEYVERDNVDLTQWTDKSIESCTFDGEVYALPNGGGSAIQMYYNIDLLAQAGYDEPPATMEELYEMALKITTLDESGNIDVLGYPLFPLASARQELIYAFGGRWWDDDGNLTPQSEGILDSLHMNMRFREQYGIEQVQAFIGTANTNRYTEQDMFLLESRRSALTAPGSPQ